MNTHFSKWTRKSCFQPARGLIALLILGGFIFLPSAEPVCAGEHLPDGAKGKPGLQVWGYRTDITFDDLDPRGADGAEFTSGKARILIPLSRGVTLFAAYRAENRLNILHQARMGFHFRTSQPDTLTNSSAEINADGPLGHAYFTISGGFRTYETKTDVRFGIASFEITYPWTHSITISAGTEVNTDTSITIVDKYFGSLSFYPARYLPSEPYANPDGPVGFLNFRLSGGGSSDGVFGQLDILFPLTDQATIGGFVRGERVTFPYQRSATLGVGFQLYPGVIR